MIRNSIARAVSSLVTRPVNGAKLSFEIVMKKLVANGELIFWNDPNDMGTMFQDAAGTVPVTAVGQAVGLIRDKSGRNNHARQTVSASRPILRKNAVTGANYLEFDGSDDFLVTNSINFTDTDKVSLFAGVTNLKDPTAIIAELSNSASVNGGTFSLVSGADVGVTGYTTLSRGTASAAPSQAAKAAPYLAPNTSILSAKHDISGQLSTLRVNAVKGVDGTGNKGAGNFGNYPLYIGRRGGAAYPFNGHVYGLIGIGKLASDAETAAIEKELAKRVGVTLNV